MPEIRVVIVGTKHKGTEALDALGALTKGAPVSLRREPENPADSGAVACYIGDIHCGYVPRAQYSSIRDALDAALTVTAELTTEAIVDGGEVKAAPRITARWEEDANS